jgi:amidophosphoribosyltransferase
MCGIVGIYGEKGKVIEEMVSALVTIQHRGQDACGVVTYDYRFNLHKGLGLVQHLLRPAIFRELTGNIGIGHVRYPTVGGGSPEDAQPFYVNTPYGIAMAHNGNVVNYRQLKKELFAKSRRHLNSDCDVEIILNVFASELEEASSKSLGVDSVFRAVEGVFGRVNGSYSVVSLIAQSGLLAFRDPHGIKPLIYGERDGSTIFASESAVLDVLGYRTIGDVRPGEAVWVDTKGKIHSRIVKLDGHQPCIFEWVYFARPDSVIDGISVYEARLRLGKSLAKDIRKAGIQPEVVIPVPDTARAAALALAEDLGTAYREGLIKNRYIGRTFIMPVQKERKRKVKEKLNPIKIEILGKKVLLVDDSIVRGTTAREIISLVRDAGASEVYFASCSPPLRYPCVYGIDMQTKRDFIARERTIPQIEAEIGADRLFYQTLNGLLNSVKPGMKFCTACFNNEYPTPVPEEIFSSIERERLRARSEK